MKKLILYTLLPLLVVSMLVGGCGNVSTTPNTSDTDSNTAVFDDAVDLVVSGDYYESGPLTINEGNRYVFKLDNNRSGGHNMSTLYMYNARRRMGSNFLDGKTADQDYTEAYWQIKLYDADKNPIDVAILHPLSSQLCYTDSWDDYFEFEQGSTYYMIIDVIKSASGTYYFSVY